MGVVVYWIFFWNYNAKSCRAFCADATRNGNFQNKKNYPKAYAQKVMYLQEGQRMPVHYHKNKMEDIINQGCGTLVVKIWQRNNNEKAAKGKPPINSKSIINSKGKTISLKPGESFSVLPYTLHQFWAKEGSGSVLSMEISSVNDDLTDNIWVENCERFPKITEDAEGEFVLCFEYVNLLKNVNQNNGVSWTHRIVHNIYNIL